MLRVKVDSQLEKQFFSVDPSQQAIHYPWPRLLQSSASSSAAQTQESDEQGISKPCGNHVWLVLELLGDNLGTLLKHYSDKIKREGRISRSKLWECSK
ncbi:hypothetical protein SUGI_1170800 [Cryptomeria japonica]|nr:hypothetical protein SUGI_1170800 [Cryptomeria japonica]